MFGSPRAMLDTLLGGERESATLTFPLEKEIYADYMRVKKMGKHVTHRY